MIKIERITDPSCGLFGRLMQLYRDAFPPCERRTEEQLKDLITSRDNMYFNAVWDGGTLAGLFVYWDMGDFRYLEHLAIFDSMRNRNIGGRVLEWIAANLPGLCLLEAEPEDGRMASRRIGFYRRNGYQVLSTDYIQPSYEDGSDACPLWILGNGPAPRLTEHIAKIKSEVYGVRNCHDDD